MTNELVKVADQDNEIIDQGGNVVSFAFGDIEPVLDRGRVFDYFELWSNGKWYEPPVSLVGLEKTLHGSPHHESAIRLKVNMLKRFFEPSKLLPMKEFERLALDLIVFGCAYPERIDNIAGRPMALQRSPALWTRVGKEPGQHFYLPKGNMTDVHEFKADRVYQIQIPDTKQEIYGVPEYLAALNAIWLNDDATIFRLKYYRNGSHAGYIFYVSEEGFSDEDSKSVKKAMKDAKGPGNFRNMFLHIPKGKKDGVQIIPISEVMAKDEFNNIKSISRDDILAAHRVPPQLLGIVPQNAGGFGSAPQSASVFFEHEIEPLQLRMLEINDWLGRDAVSFRDYVPPATVGAATASG